MIYDNMSLSENTLPLENIVPAQNAANLQGALAHQAASSNNVAQNARGMQNVPQRNMGAHNMMPSHNMNTMSAENEGHGSTNNKSHAKQHLAHCCFAVHEAVLYLDTHPNDQNAMAYYQKKQQQLIQASENYQKVVGPTRSSMVDTSSGSWRWVETPWPWEIEEG